jgi:hypothetical protein
MSENAEAPAAEAAPTPAAPAPASAPAPAPASWRDTLPDDLKAAKSLEKYGDVPALAKAYVDAEALIGRKGAIIPKEGDAPEVTAAWRKALGVPEKADGYTIARPEDVPEALWSDGTAAKYREIAHKHGLTPAQAQAVAGEFLQHQAGEVAALAQAGQEAVATLRKEWGAKFEQNVTLATRAAAAFLPGDLLDMVLPTGQRLGDHPDMVKAFAKIGAAQGEDAAPGLGTGRTGLMTPSEAKTEAAKLIKQISGMSKIDPERNALVDRLDQVQRMRDVA